MSGYMGGQRIAQRWQAPLPMPRPPFLLAAFCRNPFRDDSIVGLSPGTGCGGRGDGTREK